MTTQSQTMDMEASLNITFMGKEIEERDFYETAHGEGDSASYTTHHFTRTRFVAEGFALCQGGCQITGFFHQPIDAVVVEIDDNGEELESEYNDGVIARAVLAKLGGIPDVEGGLRAAAGV